MLVNLKNLERSKRGKMIKIYRQFAFPKHKQCVYSCMWFRITRGRHFSNVPRRARLMQSKEIKTPQVQNSNVPWWNSWHVPLLNSKGNICQAEENIKAHVPSVRLKNGVLESHVDGGECLRVYLEFLFFSAPGEFFLPVSPANIHFSPEFLSLAATSGFRWEKRAEI